MNGGELKVSDKALETLKGHIKEVVVDVLLELGKETAMPQDEEYRPNTIDGKAPKSFANCSKH